MDHRQFWNKEYQTAEHLALSTEPSEDLEKFTRWQERQYKREYLNPLSTCLDLGCGNGRNLIYLAEKYGMHGIGFDISDVAINAARKASEHLPIVYEARSIAGEIPDESESLSFVLDMMTSHFLKRTQREELQSEIYRVLKPGGWLFFKSFLADEDLHTKRLLRDHPADEEGAYIHPKLGVYEYAWTEESVYEFFKDGWEIHKFTKSHKHIRRHSHGGRPEAGKRRTFSAYIQKF